MNRTQNNKRRVAAGTRQQGTAAHAGPTRDEIYLTKSISTGVATSKSKTRKGRQTVL